MPQAAAARPATGTWGRDIVTLLVVAAMPAVGVGLFFRASVVVSLGVAAGLTAGLGCSKWPRAAIVAAGGVLGGFPLAPLVSQTPWQPGLGWLPDALAAAVLAAIVAALTWLAGARSARLRPAFAALAVLVLIAAMWTSGFDLAAAPRPEGSSLQALSTTPRLTSASFDEQIYLTYVLRLRSGDSYYPMVASLLDSLNKMGRPFVATHSVLSYRLPTLYWLLASLPPGASWLIGAMLAACSIGVVAAYGLARQFVFEPLGILGALVLSSAFAGYAAQLVLNTEPWAGILALVAVALAVAARRHAGNALALQAAAALAAFAAASIRELAVAVLVVGLIGALADRSAPARRTWLPWAIALAGIAAVYAGHALAARAAFAGVTATAAPTGSAWFHPDGSGLIAGVGLFARRMWLTELAATALIALGLAGSLLAPRDLSTRIILGGVALGGPLTLVFLRPGGMATHGVPAYWAYLVIPTTLACVPLAFAWLRPTRREDRSAQT